MYIGTPLSGFVFVCFPFLLFKVSISYSPPHGYDLVISLPFCRLFESLHWTVSRNSSWPSLGSNLISKSKSKFWRTGLLHYVVDMEAAVVEERPKGLKFSYRRIITRSWKAPHVNPRTVSELYLLFPQSLALYTTLPVPCCAAQASPCVPLDLWN